MTVVSDSGPLLHLNWLGALSWALPLEEIYVVETVWQEVTRLDPSALKDARLKRVADPITVEPELLESNLDPGELSALGFALAVKKASIAAEILVLCDENDGRDMCKSLGIRVTGSVGLIIEAARLGRVHSIAAEQAIRDLPTRGRCYVASELIERSIGLLRDALVED